ncbi:MAG: HAMP domain-containing histidine kinase [Candidatus Pacebacteria bacterium]|nr:HAMP domain-containing histidine kinase [Candidatus Paceibacterota bacterium]
MKMGISKITEKGFSLKRYAYFLFEKLIKPKSKKEDIQRQEFILNILLFTSIILIFVVFITTAYNYVRLGNLYNGISPYYILIILSIFISLFIFSYKSHINLASYNLVIIYFLAISHGVYYFGVGQPQILLSFVLVIIITGILINYRFSFLMTLLISFILIFFGYLQTKGIYTAHTYWKNELVIKKEDPIIFSIILIIIFIVSWLSNREIRKSLNRARKSEVNLRAEKDSLEIKITERTNRLKETQTEKAIQLYRFAEFGRMASGIFHDLVNPLTAMTLNIEKLQKKYEKIGEDYKAIEKVANNIEEMKRFTDVARKQIQNQKIKITFSLADEITLALETLSYKTRKDNIRLIFNPPNILIRTKGNPIKFYRIISDLVANSIDACKAIKKETKKNKKQVEVSLSQKRNIITITIKDWGCGIKKKYINKIFEPLFTTKGIDGTGLGLSICKDVVEKDFNGKIKLRTKEGKGTIFMIEIPVRS